MDLIQRIRCEAYGLDLPKSQGKESRVIASLSEILETASSDMSDELYSMTTRFVLELIQNADDNTYADGTIPTLAMEMKGNRLFVRSNEVGFTEEDVHALCNLGKSNKSDRRRFTGEKGIGFKSVFAVADVVHISSGPYRFKFDKKMPVGMLAPIWDQNCPSRAGWTMITLDLRQTKNLELVSHLADLRPSLLLFLRRLQCIQIIMNGNVITMKRESIPSVSSTMVKLERSGSTASDATDYYFTYSHVVKPSVQEPKRADLTQTTIVLAFPVTESGEPIQAEQEVFAFLPLRSYGLPFVIHADFLTALSREDILWDSPWNKDLRGAIPNAFIDDIMQLQSRHSMTYSWIRYFPHSITSRVFKPMHENLIKQLAQRPVMLCRDKIRRCPSEVLILPPLFQDHDDGTPLIPSKHIAPKVYLASEYDISDLSAYVAMGIEVMTQESFLKGLKAMEHEGSLYVQDEDWWGKVCRVLLELCINSTVRAVVRQLKIAPLVSDTWVTPVEPGIYFDSALDDIPQDLNLKLVKCLDTHSPLRRLLEDLGIREIDCVKVAKRINTLHSGPVTDLNPRMLPSHAKFLFKHSSEVPLFHMVGRLKVLTNRNAIASADSVYMDHPNHISPTLSSCLAKPHSPAQFLHADYDVLPWPHPEEELRTWKEWLHGKLHVHISPKICDNSLSPEFARFLNQANGTELLMFLKEYTPDMIERLRACPLALKELRRTPILTSDGRKWPLEGTNLARRSLLQFIHLPFLSVQDPEDPSWDFLRQYGVSVQVGGILYLDELRRLRKEHSDLSEDIPDGLVEQIKTLYKQLDARDPSENLSDAIREAFQEQTLILLPAEPGVREKTHWVNSNIVWDGPPCMRSRYALKKYYAEFESLFCEQLQIPRWPEGIILQEFQLLRQRHSGRQLSEDDQIHVFEILRDLGHILDKNPGWTPTTAPDWLKELRNLAFIPVIVKTASKTVKLRSLKAHVFLPDLKGYLAKIFAGTVRMVAQPPEESGYTLQEMHRLFRSPLLEGVKSLEDAVQKTLGNSGSENRFLNVEKSEYFKARVPYIRRQDFVSLLVDIQIYDISPPVVEQIFTLDGVKRTVTRSLGVELDSSTRVVVLVGSACLHTQFHSLLCIDLARLCPQDAISPSELLSIFTQPPYVLEMLFPPGPTDTPLSQNASLNSPFDRGLGSFSGSHTSSLYISNGQPPSNGFPTSASPYTPYTEPYLLNDRELSALLAADLPALDEAVARSPVAASYPAPLSSGPLSPQAYRSGASLFQHNANWNVSGIPGAPYATMSPGTSIGGSEPNYIGLVGEIYVYRLLTEKFRLPRFDYTNWTSRLRSRADLGFPPFEHEETAVADFEYHDHEGMLTKVLFGLQTEREWSSSGWPTYYLEVKASNGPMGEPFHISASQLSAAMRMSYLSPAMRDLRVHNSHPNPRPPAVYVLVRVYNISTRSALRYEMVADPWAAMCAERMAFVSGTEMALAPTQLRGPSGAPSPNITSPLELQLNATLPPPLLWQGPVPGPMRHPMSPPIQNHMPPTNSPAPSLPSVLQMVPPQIQQHVPATSNAQPQNQYAYMPPPPGHAHALGVHAVPPGLPPPGIGMTAVSAPYWPPDPALSASVPENQGYLPSPAHTLASSPRPRGYTSPLSYGTPFQSLPAGVMNRIF